TDYLAFPPSKEVSGTVAAPPSKSATNRALVLAALSEEAVEIVRPLESEDTRVLGRCLTAMGATLEPVPQGLRVGGPLAGPAPRGPGDQRRARSRVRGKPRFGALCRDDARVPARLRP